jgi:hypothetical protein
MQRSERAVNPKRNANAENFLRPAGGRAFKPGLLSCDLEALPRFHLQQTTGKGVAKWIDGG